ncbi:MAG: hypothetical protein R2879_20760 [Saprospiraceae bacterium]
MFIKIPAQNNLQKEVTFNVEPSNTEKNNALSNSSESLGLIPYGTNDDGISNSKGKR